MLRRRCRRPSSSALDAALDIADIAEAAGVPVDEIAEIDEARVVAHDDIVRQRLAEMGARIRADRLLLGWRLRLACERGMSITTAAAAAAVTVDEAAVLIEQSPFPQGGPVDVPAD